MEINKTKCGTCGEEHMRILVGKYKSLKKWVDERGLNWNGKKYCGLCNLQRIRSSMSRLRSQRKTLGDPLQTSSEAPINENK